MDFKPRVDFSGVGYRYQTDDIEVVSKAMQADDTFTQGRQQQEFQDRFSKLMDGGFSFAMSNAASAIDIVARLLGLGPGDEVIVPAHTYTASAYPFTRSGAKIRWADVDNTEWVVTADTIKKVLTPQTRVIVAVDLYGLPVDIEPIVDLAAANDVFVLSDSAQAIGARYGDGSYVGSKSHAAVFSFQTHKNISTLGEGGVLWFPMGSPFVDRVEGLRHNGHAPYSSDRAQYWFPAMVNVTLDSEGVLPLNYCLGEVQCALGSHLLDKVTGINNLRKNRFDYARRELEEYFGFQTWHDKRASSYHLLPIRHTRSTSHNQTNEFIAELVRQGIRPAKQYYPLYKYDFYRKLGMGEAKVPVTDHFYMQQISLPFQSWMPEADFEWMIQTVKKLAVA